MRRPRHREKSNLLWKMVGVAGAINLVLWPILIHEGVFAGIRREVLIPVSLVPLPPSNKLPDTLQKVSRTSMASVPLTPSSSVHSQKPSVSSQTKTPSVLTAQKPKPLVPLGSVRVASASVPRLSVSPPTPVRPVAARRIAHPVESHSIKAVHSSPSAHPSVPVPNSAERAVIAARVVRAKDLEAQGHLVAEKIARDRSARLAAQTNGPDPDTSATVAASPAGPAVTPIAQPDTVTVVTSHAPRSAPRGHAALPVYVPAVAISKTYPAVPDRMMTTTWHATFQGRMAVHPDGTTTVEIVSSTGFPVLDRRSLEAARCWKFHPARLNGKAVASSRSVVFAFDVHAVP